MAKPTAPYAHPQTSPLRPRIESWRVITQAGEGQRPVSDATLRVRIGDRRLIASGEGFSPAHALGSGIADALQSLADGGTSGHEATRLELLAQCGLAVGSAPAVSRLRVEALDGNAMLHRLTTLLGSHDVEEFSYRTQIDGRARITLGIRETGARVGQLAMRLRRVVGVLDVAVETAGAA